MDQVTTAELGDGELWLQASQGDPAAFGVLFERHVNAVYTHCFRRTGSWEAAEDLSSVVFLEAWRRRREVALSGESILPWLLAVANNVVRNRDRSLRRHRRLLAKLPTSVAAPDPAEDTVARVDDERAMQRVLHVFTRLLPDEQDVLALCVWAGLSYADAAVALGVPIGTVRSRLSRARTHLRQLAEVNDSGAGNEPSSRQEGPETGESDVRGGSAGRSGRATKRGRGSGRNAFAGLTSGLTSGGASAGAAGQTTTGRATLAQGVGTPNGTAPGGMAPADPVAGGRTRTSGREQ